MGMLERKNVIVTGAAGSIGEAVTRRVVAEGGTVLAVDLDDGGLAAAYGDRAGVETFAADVTDPERVAAYVDHAVETLGSLDGFVNNAGVEGPVAPIADYGIDDFDHLVAVNVRGVFLGLKHVLPVIADGGSIVNTSSSLGLVGAAGVGPYVASKHAVVGLTKSAALEAAERRVRVNAVCPGPIAGRMISALEEQAFAGTDTTFADFVPLGRHGTPDEVAALVVWLLSDDAAFATGSAHEVGGGYTTA